MRTKGQQRYFLLYSSMFVFYIIAFWGIIRSWYMYDDLINYTCSGHCINHDISTFDLTKRIAGQWYEQNGRCFVFASYTYILFSIVKNVYVYKGLLVLITFLDAVLMSRIIGKLTKSKKIEFLVILLFPCFVSLDCRYFNAMYGFHGMLQMCLLWVLISIYAFMKFKENQSIIWQIFSCVSLSLALGTYEVAYVLCVVFPLVAFVYTKNVKRSIISIVPQTLTGIVWLGINIYARGQASAQYAGTTIHIGVECIEAFWKQISGSWSALNVLSARELATAENIKMVLKSNGLRYMFLAIVVFVGCVFICDRKEHIKNNILAFVIGLVIMVGPAVLIAISQRYQQEISWGQGYLPAFVSCWGIVICGSIIVAKIKSKVIKVFLLGVPCALLIILSQMISDITVQYHNSANADAFVAEAVAVGVLDEVSENDIIIEGTANWNEIDSHYAFLTERKMNAISWHRLYELKDDKLITTEYFDNAKGEDLFYYTKFQNNQFFCIAKCNDLEIFIGEENNLCRIFWTQSFDIYVPGDVVEENVLYVTKEGDVKETKLNQHEIVSKSNKGCVYRININEVTNVETITLK